MTTHSHNMSRQENTTMTANTPHLVTPIESDGGAA